MDKYVCIRKCYHRGILFNVGDPYTPKPEEEIPRHFKKIVGKEEPPKPEPILEELTKKKLITHAENLGMNLEELELSETSRKAELISAIKAKERDAKLNIPTNLVS